MKPISRSVLVTIALSILGIGAGAVYALFPGISNTPTPDSSWSSNRAYRSSYPYESPIYLNTSKSVPIDAILTGNVTLFNYPITSGAVGQNPPRLYVYESGTFLGLSNDPLPTPVFYQVNYTYHSGPRTTILQFSFEVPSATVYYFFITVHSGYTNPEAELHAIVVQSLPQWWFRWLPVVGLLLVGIPNVLRLPGVWERIRKRVLRKAPNRRSRG